MSNGFTWSKRLIALLLVALLGTLAAACGSDDSNEPKKNEGEQAAKTGKAKKESPDTGSATTGETEPGTGADVTTRTDPVGGGRFFAANSPWNTKVDGLPAARNSARMLDLAMQRRAVREVPGQQGVETIVRRVNEGLFINTDAWAPLIVEAGGDDAEATKFVCRQSKCGSGEPGVPENIPIPANTTPDPRYDGWLSVIDRGKGLAYDFWRARRQTDSSISYQYAKAWTLDGPGFSKPVSVDPERAVGARGSGLPLFAGVISPSEATDGQINHALAISVPGLARRNFVQPASVTDGVGSPQSLPAGARIRLRANVTAESRDRNLKGDRKVSAESILIALREYGAIVVDRSVVPTLYAPKGTSNKLIRGSELSWLSLDDFEVIQLPQIYKDPPLSQVNLEGPETGEESSGATQSGSEAGESQ
ncbi:MAG: hypothetical protein M3Y45_04885 [Actinomycetota bacterium]|nr:hypothetical protein [Actinomycetota bacterium]